MRYFAIVVAISLVLAFPIGYFLLQQNGNLGTTLVIVLYLFMLTFVTFIELFYNVKPIGRGLLYSLAVSFIAISIVIIAIIYFDGFGLGPRGLSVLLVLVFSVFAKKRFGRDKNADSLDDAEE